MMPAKRSLTNIDRLIGQLDRSLSSLTGNTRPAKRPSPADSIPSTDMDLPAAKHVAGLMRVNHTGEVCAQALYQGQAATAKLPVIKNQMREAALEEEDHLAWCQQRLTELNSHTSRLNPLFYAGSFGIGALAGLVGDKWSLGFVAETEKQVCSHLQNHLDQLPENDTKTRAILQKMSDDEAQHATQAIEAGAADLPRPIKTGMKLISKIMTTTSYRI